MNRDKIIEEYKNKGLTERQIGFIDRPGFDVEQMEVAANAFLQGLTKEQINTFYRPEVCEIRMSNIVSEILGNKESIIYDVERVKAGLTELFNREFGI